MAGRGMAASRPNGLNISKQGRWPYCKGSDAIAFSTGARP